jgi:hypothetical protein
MTQAECGSAKRAIEGLIRQGHPYEKAHAFV